MLQCTLGISLPNPRQCWKAFSILPIRIKSVLLQLAKKIITCWTRMKSGACGLPILKKSAKMTWHLILSLQTTLLTRE